MIFVPLDPISEALDSISRQKKFSSILSINYIERQYTFFNIMSYFFTVALIFFWLIIFMYYLIRKLIYNFDAVCKSDIARS